MHAVQHAVRLADVSRVIERLDHASSMLGLLNPERGQAIIYAGFLTDIESGRIDLKQGPVASMVDQVDQFCMLVEREFAEPNYTIQ